MTSSRFLFFALLLIVASATALPFRDTLRNLARVRREATCEHNGRRMRDGERVREGQFINQCEANEDGWRVHPVACVTPSGSVGDGDRFHVDGYVQVCRISDNRARTETVGCIDPNGNERDPGEYWKADNTGSKVICLDDHHDLYEG